MAIPIFVTTLVRAHMHNWDGVIMNSDTCICDRFSMKNEEQLVLENSAAGRNCQHT